MKRALIMVGAGVALATAVMVTLTTGATAAPLGAVTQTQATEPGANLVVQINGRRGWGGHRHGGSFGFYIGAPRYYSYGYSNCWWSHRYHRRVCSY